MTPDNIVATPIQDGDAGLIIRADGTMQLFNCFDMSDPSKITQAQIATHEKLMALALATQLPDIMDVLLTMAQDPDIVGEDGINAVMQ